MAPFLEKAMTFATGYWTRSTLVQRILLGGALAVALIAIGMLFYLMNKVEYRILYTRLGQEDASRVVEQLKGAKEPYKLEDGGTTILVPTERVYDLRLKIAGEGIIHGQGIGFEIFDQVKIGQTDFVQHINYQRALQGELARTIQEFPQIENARVHIVLPSKSLFIEEQRQPTASVVLKIRNDQKLEQKQIQGIVNLVASSVEGLTPEHITITDTTGKYIYQSKGADSVEGLTSAKFEYKTGIEQSLQSRIEQMLTPVVGPGKVIARVNADVDYSQKTIKKETYDPNSQVIRSEQRSDEEITGRANLEGGIPEANYIGTNGTGSISQQSSTRSSRTTNYEINREETHISVPVGELHRMTVAVIVDGEWQKPEGQKDFVFVPRSQQELTRIRELVKSAVGFDESRGDTIEVSSISFGKPEQEPPTTFVATLFDYAQRIGRPFMNGLLILLFLVLVVRPVVMALIKPRVTEEPVPIMEPLPEAEQRIALAEPEVEENLAIAAMKRLEDIKAHTGQLADQNMDQALTVIRNWMREEA